MNSILKEKVYQIAGKYFKAKYRVGSACEGHLKGSRKRTVKLNKEKKEKEKHTHTHN